MDMVRIIVTLQDVVLIGLTIAILLAVLCSLIIGYLLSAIGKALKKLKWLQGRLSFRPGKSGADNRPGDT